jgi:hypothetical protein
MEETINEARRMFRAVAYKTPEEEDLTKYAQRLAREADVDDLTFVKEGASWVLKQGSNRLTAAYSKSEAVACLSGYVAGLRTAKKG